MAYDDKGSEPVEQETGAEEDVQSIVRDLIGDSVTFADDDLAPMRAEATEYYLGEPFGTELEGRSQYISTEVRDAVHGILPSLLKVFFGAERAVEFQPRNQEDVENAEQASDYVQYIFEKNGGFMKAHSVMLDGLVRKMGVFKWAWQDEEPTTHSGEGLTKEQLVQLVSEGAELTKVEEMDAESDAAPAGYDSPDAGAPPAPLYRAEYTRGGYGCPKIWALPPEEFIYSREARSVDDGLFVGHRTEKSRGELIAMGIDEEILDEWGHKTDLLQDNEEAWVRRSVANDADPEAPDAGEANEDILYVEGYARIDVDGDGVAELRKVCTIGPLYHLVKDPEPADEVPFSIFVPFPEPHTITGQSLADKTMDLQRLTSFLTRAMLDSGSMSIFPRTWYVRSKVNVADLLNQEMGGVVGMDAPGMAGEFAHSFMGKDLLAVLAYFDEVKERRTGQNKGALGLDADALQSTTKSAADAAVGAAQEAKEMIARFFAEMALKPLFRGIYRMLIEHQPRKEMVRLRNRWVEIDPAKWNADADLVVNVALGAGMVEQRLAVLANFAMKQEQILTMLGPQNPLVSLGQYAHALRTALELSGRKDTQNYINALPIDWQPPPTPPQPSPEEQLVQLEAQKAQIQAQAKQQEMQLKQQQAQVDVQIEREKLNNDREKMQAELALKRQELEAEIALKIKELELQHQIQLEEARIKAEIQRSQAATQSAIEQEKFQREDSREERRLQSEESREGRKLESDERVTNKKIELEEKKVAAKAKPAKAPKKRRVKVLRGDDNRISGFEEDGA